MNNNPLTAIDFYKADHRSQYPKGTTLVYSNLTPRSNRLTNLPDGNENVVFFGLQYFIKDFLQFTFDEFFFQQTKEEVVEAYKRRLDNALGEDAVSIDHIEALHDLGYLPLEIRALPEGTKVPMGVPVLTIHNTHPDFFWLVNYLESVMSAYMWLPCTSATTANWYKKVLTRFARDTGASEEFVPFQGHDFSYRGMTPYSAPLSGAGHLLSFVGTDTVQAIDFLEDFYGANSDAELVGCSVPATEHSVMCMGTETNELETFRRLVNETYPAGIVSIVSDTWDFWQVVTTYAKKLKKDIMKRDGKVVFRPDSGDPVKIICGDKAAKEGTPEHKGAVECLYEIFGGKENDKGFKELDEHVGLIYGDSITPERCLAILEGLKEKGFASSNVVFGIGSFTYQYVTRDTWGFAVKATYGEVNGEPRNISKDPKTDSGSKKSHCGLLKVTRHPATNFLQVDQEVTWEDSEGGELELVYKDGELVREQSLSEIRHLMSEQD